MLSGLWLDWRGAQCDLPKHTAATPTVNSVWPWMERERDRRQERYERYGRGEESGEDTEKEEGWRKFIMVTKCARIISCDVSVCVLCNDRVTDLVLVSICRYPVLKNPFKLVKPLTHRTLDCERVCVCVAL